MTIDASSPFERAITRAGPAAGVSVTLPARDVSLPEAPARTLELRAARDPDGRWHWCAGTPPLEPLPTTGCGHAWTELQRLCERHDLDLMPLVGPLPLQPAAVPKPWGTEIWYTGIEARGVAGVGARPPGLPLPWLLRALPGHGGGLHTPLLVKHLQPHPEPVYGDLYFEHHARKEELYLVTAVDPRAWPDGGRIRLGFRAPVIAELGTAELRRAFAASAHAYAGVRARIDERLDACRRAAGVALDRPLPPARLAAWNAELPRSLRDEEVRRRRDLEAFIDERPVAVGDVIHVPPGVPHGLRHGIHVLEVQTPDYERQILYFGQKVLSHGGGDLDAACARMRLDTPPATTPVPLPAPAGVTRERLATIDDWQIERLCLAAGATWNPAEAACAIVVVAHGSIRCGHLERGMEQAAWLPGPALAARACPIAAREPATLLLARYASPA